MYYDSIVVRKSDKKEFKVTFLSHWSDVESLDGLEKDSIKWYGNSSEGELYISANKGYSYIFTNIK